VALSAPRISAARDMHDAIESSSRTRRSAVAALLSLAVLVLSACRREVEVRTSAIPPALEPGWTELANGHIQLKLPNEPVAASPQEIAHWVDDAVRAVEAYYGRLPAARTRIELTRSGGRGIDGGNTSSRQGGPWIRIALGARADAAALARDWVLTHELVHTAIAEMPAPHHWFEEGLATYVEPIARAQAGLESAADVWKQLVEGLPQGLPEVGDRGLDRTHTWGRTYWGGALFCLLADIEIHERTQNRSGLQDALRALVDEGLTMETEASIAQILARADAAVGGSVLSDLYARHATRSETVDLAALWRQLGITYSRHRVRFDDDAPLAAVRRAITRAE
jgi:hypothetical protein